MSNIIRRGGIPSCVWSMHPTQAGFLIVEVGLHQADGDWLIHLDRGSMRTNHISLLVRSIREAF
jgi:hypothetical protein